MSKSCLPEKITTDRLRKIQNAVFAGHHWKALQMLEKHGVRNKKIRRKAKGCNRLMRYISSTHSQFPGTSFRKWDSDLQEVAKFVLSSARKISND